MQDINSITITSIKAIWNDLTGVRSNEYPWASENGSITDPAYYAAHFAELPNRF